MSELRLTILEPLTKYFAAASQSSSLPIMNNSTAVKQEPKETELGDIASLYYSAYCYTGNDGSQPGDISYQFMSALKKVAENMRDVDESKSCGTLKGFINISRIKKILSDQYLTIPNNTAKINTFFNNTTSFYTVNTPGTSGSPELLNINKDLSYSDNALFIDDRDMFNTELKTQLSSYSQCTDFIDFLDKKYNGNAKELADLETKYTRKIIRKEDFPNQNNGSNPVSSEIVLNFLTDTIVEDMKSYYDEVLSIIYDVDFKRVSDSSLAKTTIEQIKSNKVSKELFERFFSVKEITTKKDIKDYEAVLTRPKEYRINIKKDPNGHILLFSQLLPIIDSSDYVYLTKTDKISGKPELVKAIAEASYYKTKGFEHYGLDVDAHVDKIKTSDASLVLDPSKCKDNRKSSVDVEKVVKKINEFITSYKTRKSTIRPEFYYAWKSDNPADFSAIEAGMKFNGWLYNPKDKTFKKKVNGKYIEISQDDVLAEKTCDAITTDMNRCVEILEIAGSGDYSKVKELLKDSAFINALKKKQLDDIPPIIALNFLKGLGFKKRRILAGRNTIVMIEPVNNWVNRVVKNKTELKNLLTNDDVMTLIKYMKTIVHMNPTILGNDPSVVLEKEEKEPPKVTVDVRQLSPEESSKHNLVLSTPSTSLPSPNSLKEIMENLSTKPVRKFYQGLRINDPTTLSLANLNPAINMLLNMNLFPNTNLKTYLGMKGGANSFVDTKHFSLEPTSANLKRLNEEIKEKIKTLGISIDSDILRNLSVSIRTYADQEEEILDSMNKISKLISLKELGFDEIGVDEINEEKINNIIKDYNTKVNDLSKKNIKLYTLVDTVSQMIDKKKTGNSAYRMNDL